MKLRITSSTYVKLSFSILVIAVTYLQVDRAIVDQVLIVLLKA